MSSVVCHAPSWALQAHCSRLCCYAEAGAPGDVATKRKAVCAVVSPVREPREQAHSIADLARKRFRLFSRCGSPSMTARVHSRD